MRVRTVACSSGSRWLMASRWRRSPGSVGPRSSSVKTSEFVLTHRARARARRTLRVGWLVPAS
jgi:hypothetical protein